MGSSSLFRLYTYTTMNPVSMLMLGLAMSTDAFAAALARGAVMFKPRLFQAMQIGLIFGVVETITPIIGWLIGSVAAEMIENYDHWVTFLLLTGLGLHTIYQSSRSTEDTNASAEETLADAQAGRRSLMATALTGLATSIDAMAVGVGLAFVNVNILAASLVIGFCTFVMVTIGVLAGKAVGMVIGRWSGILGGLILIVVGALILRQHLVG